LGALIGIWVSITTIVSYYSNISIKKKIKIVEKIITINLMNKKNCGKKLF